MPNREKFKGKVDPVFFFAYDRIMEIHQTPIYIAEWPSEDGANLDGDSHFTHLPPHTAPGLRNTLDFFDLVLQSAMQGRDLSTLWRERLIVDLRNEIRRVGYQQVPAIKDFKRLKVNMPTGEPLTAAGFHEWLADRCLEPPTGLPDRIEKRDRYLVLSLLVKASETPDEARRALRKRIKYKGGDPYTQQSLVFDYLFCRLGPSPLERDVNLVIDLSPLFFSDFAQYVADAWERSPLSATSFRKVKDKVPIYTLHLTEGLSQVVKNFVRLSAFSSDIIVFRDGLLHF